MTLLDDKASHSGSYIEVVQQNSKADTPAAVLRRTGGREPAGLRLAFAAAVAITTIIAAASFVLSFATLWDLATRAGLPAGLSWLWPVIVDGTILQATIAVIALAPYESQRSARRFFWAVLGVSALVSISSNALHAFISPSGSLHPLLAAAIATVAPVSLLAATHGIAVLSRARLPREGATPAPLPVDTTDAGRVDDQAKAEKLVGDDLQTELVLEPGEWPNWYDVALMMRNRGLTNRSRDEVVEILRGKFEHDLSNRQIAKSMDIHHSTVGRVVAAAEAVLRTR